MPPNTTLMTTTTTMTLVLVTMHREDGAVRTMRCKDSKVSLKLDRECNEIIILATGCQAKFQVLKRKSLFFFSAALGLVLLKLLICSFVPQVVLSHLVGMGGYGPAGLLPYCLGELE